MDSLQLVKRLKQPAISLDTKFDDALAASEEPKHAEIITEWVLSVLSSPSVQNERYWHLLHRVLQHQQTIAPRKILKYSHSVSPILSQLLSTGTNATSWKYVQPTLTRIWPSVLLLDSLFDLFTSLVKLLTQPIPVEIENNGLQWVVERVTAVFRQALGNANPGMKKKIHASFTEDLLVSWSLVSSRSIIYDAGTDILFNLDILRVNLLPETLFTSSIAPNILPRLFSSYMQGLKTYKAPLFHQSSSSQATSREDSGMWFLIQAWEYLSGKGGDEHRETKVKLLEVIQQDNSFIPEKANDVVRSCIFNAQIDALVVLCRIDYESTILPDLGVVLSLLLSAENPLSTRLVLLDEILKHHIKTRTLDVLFSTLLSAPTPEDSLLHPKISQEIARSIRMGFLLPDQQDSMLETMAKRLKEVWKAFYSGTSASDDTVEPKTKKRRMSVDSNTSNKAVITLDIVTRLIAFIYHAFPSPRKPLEVDLTKLLKKAIKLRKKSTPGQQTDRAVASLLRLSYTLTVTQEQDVPEVDTLLSLVNKGNGSEELCVEIYRLLLSCLTTLSPPHQQVTIDSLIQDMNKFEAVKSLVAERWLPALDVVASPQQLMIVSSVIFDPKSASPSAVVMRVLNDTEFWELPHFRIAFTSLIRQSHGQDSASYVKFSWDMLLRIPWEYLSRADRQRLMATALSSLGEADEDVRKARMAFALQCLRSMETDEGADMDYDSILQQLVDPKFERNNLRTQLVETLILKSIKTQSSPPLKLNALSKTHDWLFLCLVRAFEIHSEVPEGWNNSLTTLYTSWESSDSSDVYWHWLILGRILGISSASTSKRARTFVKGPLDSVHAHSAFGVAIEEYRASPEGEALDLVLAAYVVLQSKANSAARSGELDTMLAKLCNGMSPEEYGRVLELAIEALQVVPARSSEGTVRLAECLLKEPPQGTLNLTQSFTTRCMDLVLTRRVEYLQPPSLGAVLHFVHSRWTDRPASLRLVDLTSTWSILAHVLAASTTHNPDESTSSDVLKLILDILLAIIRLRRDLVQHTLPLLVVILRRLIFLTRSPRPALGSKQLSIVRDTMPAWFHSFHHPKLLSRVLEALTMKTVPVILSSATKGMVHQKAQSLARPLTKHAFSILSAYIDVLTDPLAVVPRQMRTDLESGIFAVCSIMGDWERKAGMASLGSGKKSQADDAKKALFKALWADYEKQHYVGLG